MDSISSRLRNFLEIPYRELEKLNLRAKQRRLKKNEKELKRYYLDYLAKEERIKAVTLCFSDLEGRLHILDFDKQYFISGYNNLTFDGSSIKGYASLEKSDLYLDPDWGSFRWLPSDIFGPGKVIIFANVLDHEGQQYSADFRGHLRILSNELKKKDLTVNIAAEIEGILLQGIDSEQNFNEDKGFSLVSSGGYFHSLPQDPLRKFIDRVAEAQRAIGFENEKDHPEVAPSQFELNYKYTDMLNAADQVQLYKLVCRQVAEEMGYTACFLPKPIAGINGSGMHTNISMSKGKENLFFDKKGNMGLSILGFDFIDRILNHANELCLVLNPSVNAYRRLDPNFEAPNQIKVSANDRGSMIRVPLSNEKSKRIEVRSISPDVNPYLVFFSLVKIGLEGEKAKIDTKKRKRVRFLSDNINDAIRQFRNGPFSRKELPNGVMEKFVERKQEAADRCPKDLGSRVKNGEILYHHEVTNQVIWNNF